MCKLKRLTKKYITLNYHLGGDNYYGRTSKKNIRKNLLIRFDCVTLHTQKKRQKKV